MPRTPTALAPLLAGLLLVGCGGSSSSHSTTAAVPVRSADTVASCLGAYHLRVLRSSPPGTSLLYDASAGPVTVLRVPAYAASVWVYRSTSIAERYFQASATDLKVLSAGNTLAIFAGAGQPTPTEERQIDACAFGAGGSPIAGPLVNSV